MTIEIICKWVSEKYNLGITSEGRVYDLGTKEELRKEYHSGRLCFRRKGEVKRIGMKSLKNSVVKKEIVLTEYLPF